MEARLYRLELGGLRLLVGRDEAERPIARPLSEGIVWASAPWCCSRWSAPG